MASRCRSKRDKRGYRASCNFPACLSPRLPKPCRRARIVSGFPARVGCSDRRRCAGRRPARGEGRADRSGPGGAGARAGAGAPRRGDRHATGLQGRLAALRGLVRRGRVLPGAGVAGDGRRLSGQPRREPRAQHHSPPARRHRQDASLQRSAMESRAPRYPGAAARPVAPLWAAGAEGGGAHPRDAPAPARHLRRRRPGAA